MRKIVWVEQIGGKAVKIFKSQKQAFFGCEDPKVMYKADAVAEIRREVFDRQEEKCLHCSKKVYWEGSIFQRMHMHEVVSKGRGGLVSLENCIGLCNNCHLVGEHGDRQPRFGEKK